MDSSTLTHALDNFEKSWSALDWWLNFWTILVVVGVVMEFVVVVIEYRHDLHEFKRGIIHSPSKPGLLIFGLGFVGASLVGTGVAAELSVLLKAGRIETDIRNTTHQLVAIVEKEAGDANLEASRLRADNLKLEAIIQPRQIASEQQRNIGLSLRSFGGTNVTVLSLAWDAEGYGLGKQIVSALKYGGLEVSDRTGSVVSPGAVSMRGVSVVFSPQSERRLAYAIRDALSSIGELESVSVVEGSATADGQPRLNVFVNPKPFETLR